MNRAQPRNRASGVRCTAWLEGRGHDRTAPIRPARPAVVPDSRARDSPVRPAVVRTRGHGTPWPATPLMGTRPARDSRTRQRAGHDGPSSQRARRAVLQRAVIRRATPGRAPTGRHPSGHATRVGRIGCPPFAADPPAARGSRLTWRLAAPLGSMNRAQPRNRASGVRCTAWLEGRGHGATHVIRPACHAVVRTHGHGTPWHAPPWWGLAGTGLAGTPPPSSGRAPHGTRVRPDGLGTTGRHPSGPQRAGHTWPSSQRATTGRAPTGRHPSGHATRVGRIGCSPSAACPRGVVEPPNVAVSGTAGRRVERGRRRHAAGT